MAHRPPAPGRAVLGVLHPTAAVPTVPRGAGGDDGARRRPRRARGRPPRDRGGALPRGLLLRSLRRRLPLPRPRLPRDRPRVAGSAPAGEARRVPDHPLWDEWSANELRAASAYMAELRALAAKEAGREVPMSANAGLLWPNHLGGLPGARLLQRGDRARRGVRPPDGSPPLCVPHGRRDGPPARGDGQRPGLGFREGAGRPCLVRAWIAAVVRLRPRLHGPAPAVVLHGGEGHALVRRAARGVRLALPVRAGEPAPGRLRGVGRGGARDAAPRVRRRSRALDRDGERAGRGGSAVPARGRRGRDRRSTDRAA